MESTTKKKRNAPKPKPAADATPSAIKDVRKSDALRASKTDGWKRLPPFIKLCARRESKATALQLGVQSEKFGTPIPGPTGAFIGTTGDGTRDQKRALQHELHDIRKAGGNGAREFEIESELAELAEQEAAGDDIAREAGSAVGAWRELGDAAQAFERDQSQVRVVPTEIPQGEGDKRTFTALLNSEAAVLANIEATESLPRVWAEIEERYDIAAEKLIKPARLAVNLDRVVLADAGEPIITFTGKAIRDPVTGAFHEIPMTGELIAGLHADAFKKFALAKARRYWEKKGGDSKAITSEERRKRIHDLRHKRFKTHLKIVGEFEACAERGIDVVLPVGLSLWAWCGLVPVRDRDLFERERRIRERD